jgi:amino acid transporter
MSAPPSMITSTLAKDRLGTGGVAQFALTAAAPLLVIAGLVTTGWAVTGVTGLPAGFAVLAGVLWVFSAGYMAMARRNVNAGALYTYVMAGLNRPAGIATANVLLIGYSALQVGLYGALGPITSGLLADRFGWDVPWWACALGAWLIVAILGLLQVDLNSRVLAVALAAELLLVAVIAVTGIVHPAGGHLTFSTLSPANLIGSGAAVALTIAVAGFIGFEQAPVYAEESKDPRRTVPMATYWALALMTVVYAGASWAMSVAAGPDAIVDQAREHPTDLMFALAAPHLGMWIETVGTVLFVTSMFAGLLAYHNAVARYTYVLGRDRVLWRRFARTALRTGAPVVASVSQSLSALLVIVIYAFAGWDPMVKLFYWGGTTGALGILIALTLTSAAVVVYFARRPDGETLWRRLIAPTLATIALGVIVWWTIDNVALLLGAAPGSSWPWILPLAYAAAAAAGLAWAGWLAAARKDVYARLGHGASSRTATPGSAVAPIGAGR